MDEPIKEGENGTMEGETSKEDYVPRSELDAAKQQLAELTSRFNNLSEALLSPDFLQRQQGQVSQQVETQVTGEQKADIDKMSREEYANHIVNKVVGVVSPLISQVAQRQEFIETKKAQDETVAKYPDYWNYRSEMFTIAKRYPTLGPEEVYLIASGKKNPPKRQEPPKVTETEKPGITTQFKNKKLSANEAASAAWDNVMGSK